MLMNLKFIDLTHTLTPDTPSWDGNCGFIHKNTIDYTDSTFGVPFRVQHINMRAGIGTHMDAPAHCIPEGATIAALPLEQLMTRCVMIKLQVNDDSRYSVSPEDIHTFEEQYGKISKNAFVIFNTGWARYWSTPEQYRNNLVFPSVDPDVAHLLLERDIAGIGIDTLSPDRPDNGFPVHELILGAGKYIVENVAHADALPAIGGYSLALPLKFAEGTESPIRLVAILSALS